MATWHQNAQWTPALAVRLADLLTEYGAGDGPVTQLRAAARTKSPILDQWAEQSYDYARPVVERHATPEEYRAFLAKCRAILTEAMGGADDGRGLDLFRPAISARAAELGLSAYAIARRCGGRPSEDAVARYLNGRAALNSRYLSGILTVLGWDGSVGWVDPPHDLPSE